MVIVENAFPLIHRQRYSQTKRKARERFFKAVISGLVRPSAFIDKILQNITDWASDHVIEYEDLFMR